MHSLGGDSESSREVLHYLLEGGIAGLRIAVQLHGATADWDPFPEFLDELRAAGAHGQGGRSSGPSR